MGKIRYRKYVENNDDGSNCRYSKCFTVRFKKKSKEIIIDKYPSGSRDLTVNQKAKARRRFESYLISHMTH